MSNKIMSHQRSIADDIKVLKELFGTNDAKMAICFGSFAGILSDAEFISFSDWLSMYGDESFTTF